MPSRSGTENYLMDFHNRCPGITTKAFSHLPAISNQRQFESSYACLADVVKEAQCTQTILDLGCGDGYLLELFDKRSSKNIRLFGIDFSMSEISSAKARLGDSATLQVGLAKSLPFENNTVDFVLSHMALMLMEDISLVISESSRVLKVGGVFSAVVGRRFLLGPVLDIFMPLLIEEMNKSQVENLKFGGGILYQQDNLEKLFENNFSKPEVVEIDIPFSVEPEDLWKKLCSTYSVDRLPEQGKRRLADLFLNSVTPLINADGLIETGWGLKKITVVRER